MQYHSTKIAGVQAQGDEGLARPAATLVAATAVRDHVESIPRRAAALPETASTQAEYVVRFDLHQRIQHILMFTSFLTLAFTGLPQKFHTLAVSQALISALGGLEMAQQVHHVAAYVMIFDCFYHGAYMAHALVVRRQLNALRMIPMPKDVLDAFQMFKYFMGFSDEKPRFGRFSYLEKFDYWAVFWGIAIIGGSGLVLLFPVAVSRIVPGSVVPVALAAHSDEALLAVAWIFVVHFFYAHFAPAVFPFNPSIFTGRVSKERYAEEHPLEYQQLFPSPEVGVVEPAESGAIVSAALVENNVILPVATVLVEHSLTLPVAADPVTDNGPITTTTEQTNKIQQAEQTPPAPEPDREL